METSERTPTGKESSPTSVCSATNSVSFVNRASAWMRDVIFPSGFELRSSFVSDLGRWLTSWSIPAAVSRLWDTSNDSSFGSGSVARVMLSEYQSPLESRVRERGFESAGRKGEKNGSAASKLCERFRDVIFGRAHIFGGKTAISLRERSRVVSAVRSAIYAEFLTVAARFLLEDPLVL